MLRFLVVLVCGFALLTLISACILPARGDEEKTLLVSPDCEITLNGQPCKLEDVPNGADVTVTTNAEGVAIRIAATTNLYSFSVN